MLRVNLNSRTQAIELKIKGLTYEEIGKVLGVSRQRAQQLTRPSVEIFNFVKKRAGGKCESCGVRLNSGHVHHLDNTEDYNDIDNLKYLCVSCHAAAHAGDWDTTAGSVSNERVHVSLSFADHNLLVKLQDKLGIRWQNVLRVGLRVLAQKEGVTA